MGTRREKMQKKTNPVLTIGMIFKNEIRCLERCMKSLEQLRKAVSCELIMADTGSDDGSREIAEHYADILFDFPWTNDFAAARNAVMDRASGEWYLSIDADEYLDPDISPLTQFLQNPDKGHENVCGITIRNYMTQELDEHYSDFIAVRMLRMSTGLRFEGTIHETWHLTNKSTVHSLAGMILHHDGYVEINWPEGASSKSFKRARNIALLRKELERNPECLKILVEYIESGRDEADYVEVIKRTVAVVAAKKDSWKNMGAPALRCAMRAATERDLPEFNEWLALAEKFFPDSIYTRIDIAHIAFIHAMNQKEYAEAIRRGEGYLKAVKKYQDNKANQPELLYGALLMASPYWVENLKIYLARAYIKERKSDQASKLLSDIDGAVLDEAQTRLALQVLGDLHCFTWTDTADVLLHFFRQIGIPEPSETRADKRRDIFFQTALQAFSSENQIAEQLDPDFCRLGYTLFLPLKEQCEAGRAAAILTGDDLNEMELLLKKVEDWAQFPIQALAHAIEKGLFFPLPEKPLTLEEMDRMAGQMATDKDYFYPAIQRLVKEGFGTDWQSLMWTRGLLLAAVRIYDWKKVSSEGLTLARFFAQVEQAFLPRYYGPGLLCRENLALLPNLHRFGWHCSNAFRELDTGNRTGYVQELRAGLDICKEMKPMVEYLMEHTPELQEKTTSAELMSLAEQIRSLLSAYPSDSPEVAALKSSPAYQKVAWLIEGKEKLE